MVVLYVSFIPIALGFVIDTFFIPTYKQKTWRYEIESNFIQLKYGAYKKHVYLIPSEKNPIRSYDPRANSC